MPVSGALHVSVILQSAVSGCLGAKPPVQGGLASRILFHVHSSSGIRTICTARGSALLSIVYFCAHAYTV